MRRSQLNVMGDRSDVVVLSKIKKPKERFVRQEGLGTGIKYNERGRGESGQLVLSEFLSKTENLTQVERF